jgi:hypothetical protein
MNLPRTPEQRDTLSEALRELAAASPQGSPELGARLGDAFARHHARRRMRQRVAVAVGLAACLAVSVVLLRTGKRSGDVKVVEHAPQTVQVPSSEPKIVAPENPKLPAPSVARASGKLRVPVKSAINSLKHDEEAPATIVEGGDFVALSTFDPAIPLGESRMVRMDLPGSALQLIGYRVDEQLLDRRILTDVLVGQDGMPYAVRLVQARNVH